MSDLLLTGATWFAAAGTAHRRDLAAREGTPTERGRVEATYRPAAGEAHGPPALPGGTGSAPGCTRTPRSPMRVPYPLERRLMYG